MPSEKPIQDKPVHTHTPAKGWKDGETHATMPLKVTGCEACEAEADHGK